MSYPGRTTRFVGMAEFIYTMTKARKAVGEKLILDDVSMSFFPGAKIGVVGPNGAGKSTILKIMAGLDTPSNGEARLSPGYTVGILLQEPPLNEEKTVLGNVQEGVGEIYGKIQRFNEISEEMASPDADYDALLEEMGQLQEAIDAADAWDIDSQLEQAMDALRCPPADADVTLLSGGERRRVALCKLLLQKPDLLLLDEPTNHLDAESVLWLEQHLSSLRRRRPGRHPRPVLPGPRGRVDRRSGPRPPVPVRGQLLHLPGEEARPPGSPGQEGRQAGQAPDRGTGVGPLQRQGPPDQVQGPSGPLRGNGCRGRPHPEAGLRRDPDPAGTAPGRRSSWRRRTCRRASTTAP